MPVHYRVDGTWEYGKRNESYPPCELEDELFSSFIGLANFAGRTYSLTGQDNKRIDVLVVHRYGTEGITIQHGTCIGRSVTE